MAKLADALDLGSSVERRASSSLALGTNNSNAYTRRKIRAVLCFKSLMGNHNKIDYIELPANNPAEFSKVKSFYGGVFGWEYEQWGDDYADTKDSGVGSGISAERPSKAPLVVIYVSDIDAAYSSVKAAGGKITKEIFSFPGGRRFHFDDPAGNELAAWSE